MTVTCQAPALNASVRLCHCERTRTQRHNSAWSRGGGTVRQVLSHSGLDSGVKRQLLSPFCYYEYLSQASSAYLPAHATQAAMERRQLLILRSASPDRFYFLRPRASQVPHTRVRDVATLITDQLFRRCHAGESTKRPTVVFGMNLC